MSWPLSLGFIASWLYILIDSVILGHFGLIIENGWFSAASKIALVAIVPADLIARSFYPILSSFFVTSKENVQKVWDYFAEIMIVLAIPMAVGGAVLSPKIIHLLYGHGFTPSILSLQLLVLVTGISFLSCPYSLLLVVADQQKKNFILILAGAVLNVILGLILMPLLGFQGVAAATIVTSIFVLVSTVVVCKCKTFIAVFNTRLLKVILISAFSSLLMYFALITLNINTILLLFVAGLIYLFVLLALYKVFFPEFKFSSQLF
jgi:O-antigen/teichoic acid export membrane protein